MVTEFVIATPHDAVEFNDVYRNTTGSAGYLACNNIYNRVVLNEWYERTPFPDLATHWECLDGARRWRFHLNQAARWQDGLRSPPTTSPIPTSTQRRWGTRERCSWPTSPTSKQ